MHVHLLEKVVMQLKNQNINLVQLNLRCIKGDSNGITRFMFIVYSEWYQALQNKHSQHERHLLFEKRETRSVGIFLSPRNDRLALRKILIRGNVSCRESLIVD